MDKVSLVHWAPVLQSINTLTEWRVTEATFSPCMCVHASVCIGPSERKRVGEITSVTDV